MISLANSGYTNNFGKRITTSHKCVHVSWTKCRDIFQEWSAVKQFFFVATQVEYLPPLLNFMHYAEKKLGLEDRTRFHETSKPRIVCVEPARFWMRNVMRKSLMTAMLRW